MDQPERIVAERFASEDGSIEVVASNRQDRPIDLPALSLLAIATLRGEMAQGPIELSMTFVPATEIEDLHIRYMHEAGATDVLAFPMGEDGLLGDVVVCPSEAERNNPTDTEAELRLLVVHGVLHLLGYDHQEEQQRAVMWRKQEAYSQEAGRKAIGGGGVGER